MSWPNSFQIYTWAPNWRRNIICSKSNNGLTHDGLTANLARNTAVLDKHNFVYVEINISFFVPNFNRRKKIITTHPWNEFHIARRGWNYFTRFQLLSAAKASLHHCYVRGPERITINFVSIFYTQQR